MSYHAITTFLQQGNLTDFANARISNYDTDIFRPIFDELEKLSGLTYGSTLPVGGSTGPTREAAKARLHRARAMAREYLDP